MTDSSSFKRASALHIDGKREEAFPFYQAAANEGVAEAQFVLANYYSDEESHFPQDPIKAAEWLKKAAGQGHAEAQTQLAFCLEHGEGVVKDVSEAKRLFQLAATQGCAPSQYRVANYLMEERNYTEAARFLRLAAEQDLEPALCALAKMYQQGRGVERSLPEATRLFKQAAALGSQQAAQELLDPLLAAGKDMSKTELEALKQRAMDGRDPEAQFLFARSLESGHGVKRNPAKAKRLLQQAAEAGWVPAQFVLARDYLESTDPAAALRWYQLAAEKEYAPAQVRLASFLSEGKSVTRDVSAAKQLLLQAVYQGKSQSSERPNEKSGCSSLACTTPTLLQTKLAICTGCRKAQYCSPACQRQDWKSRHKSLCAASLP